MPVEYRLGGTTKRAEREFYIHQHPGGNDADDIPPEMRQAMGHHARKATGLADSGDWILWADGDPRVLDAGGYPSRIGGERVSGVEIYVLNEYYTADERFLVHHNNKRNKWVTEVDGREVFADDQFHPSYIAWDGSKPHGRSRDVGSETGFVFGDSFGVGSGSGDLGF